MPGVYVGDTKSLVFPVMCDGYLQLKYLEKNIDASVDLALREGVWGHTDSFSIEAIITPYDVNGYGSTGDDDIGVGDSEKTPPSVNSNNSSLTDYMSEDYFSTTRLDRKLMIFHNANFQFYLENTTTTNVNQPAEYRLGVKVQTQSPVVSDTIIGSHNTLYGYYDSAGIYDGISTSLTNVGGSYVSQPREAFYMESLIKVGCTFHSNGTVQLFINGALIKEELVTVSGFNFGTTDCYIGQDPDTDNTQFMGELHEISMYKRGEPTLSSTTLSPGYNDILFYYRFGE